MRFDTVYLTLPESLLQFEKSDLNAQGVSILKRLYVEKDNKDSPSVNASSSEELLLGNKRFLDTESTKTKRKKMDNQQPVSSCLDGVDIFFPNRLKIELN